MLKIFIVHIRVKKLYDIGLSFNFQSRLWKLMKTSTFKYSNIISKGIHKQLEIHVNKLWNVELIFNLKIPCFKNDRKTWSLLIIKSRCHIYLQKILKLINF